MGKEQHTPFIADIEVLIPLKFPGPLQTTILLILSISTLFLFRKSERKKKAYQSSLGQHLCIQKTFHQC